MQKINPPVIRHLPVASETLAYIRSALAGVVTQGTAAGAFGGFPLNQVCVAGKTGTAAVAGKNATSVFASFAPCQHPQFVVVVMLPNSGYGADAAAPAVRAIWDGIYGLEGHKAALPGGKLPADPRHREGEGAAMSVGLPSRGWAGPRAGTFAPRRRSVLGRAFAKGGVARSWDWLLFAVTCALTVLGTVLVWAATEPALRQAGLDPHTYLKKAILWAALGFVLMMATALTDYRRIRRWTPAIYVVSLLLLLAVLAVGQSVNGAKAWIQVPGGFQVEPSEFAKLGLILSAAWLLSRRNDPTGRPRLRDAGLAALAAAPLILLVEREPALGVMLVLVFTLAGIVVVSGIRLYWVLGLLAAVAVGRLRHRQAAPAEGVPADPADLVPAPHAGPGRDRLQRPAGEDRGRLRRPARPGAVPRHVHRRQLRPVGVD